MIPVITAFCVSKGEGPKVRIPRSCDLNLYFQLGLDFQIFLMYSMVLLGLIAGAGLLWFRNLSLPPKFLQWHVLAWSKNYLNVALLIVCLALVLATTIPNRLNETYYHMISEQDYEAFVWIKENVGEGYEKAILDPWKATAFTAIAGKKVYGRTQRYPGKRAERATEFLEERCQDTEFLRENGITIVYYLFACDNSDLIELRPHVYILKSQD